MHREPKSLAKLAERVDGSAAPDAEPEVGADHNDLGVEGIDQDALHELERGLLAERSIKRENQRRIHARLGEQFHLLRRADEGRPWQRRL